MREFSARTLRPNDLFPLAYIHDGQMSPDGRRLAYVISRTVEQTGEEFFEITIEDMSTGERRRLAFPGRAMFPRWSPDGAHLAFIGIKDDSSGLYIFGAGALDIIALTPASIQVKGPPAWSPDSSTLAFTVFTHQNADRARRLKRRTFRTDGLGITDDLTSRICFVDIRQGIDIRQSAIRPLKVDITIAVRPSFSPCGKRMLFLGSEAAAGYPPLDLKLFTVDLLEESVVEVLGGRWYIAAAAWSSCGERIVLAGDYDSQLTIPSAGLWVVNRDGSNPQCRTEGMVGDVGVLVHHDMPTWATSQNNMFVVAGPLHAYAVVTKGGCAEICQVTLDGPIRCKPVISGPRTCVIMNANAETSQLLYAVSDLNTPWDLYLSDLGGEGERRLSRLNESTLAMWPALKIEHLSFESDDGMPLEAWHLTRADRQGPQPTVLFIHGGPELVAGHAFRFDFHLLAANGYAVLFSNFRGSSGYGGAFRKALKGDWGARGFPDHIAAINAAIAHGLAAPDRLGVWGPSHGGFATAWIVGHTARFRAAVAESAVTNLSTFYYLSDMPDIVVRELGGRPDEIPDRYRSHSPLTYAKRCRTPTLMLHGEDDLRCPMAEAEQFYRALHDAGCLTELVRVPGMTHMGDSTGPLPARLVQNEALLEWFERHL